MADYLENKIIGKYFRSKKAQYVGYIQIFGTYYEYRVIAGIPDENVMLEVIGVENGVLLTRVNNELFENGREFLL